MEDKKPTTEANAETIVPQEKVTTSTDDAEARIAALEEEKATLIQNEANYKIAYLKEKSKNREPDPDESEEDRIRRITREELAQTRISQIDSEKEALLKKTIAENKELKLAQLNKTDIPASTTTHTEGQKVTDTLVTPDQMAAFKAKGWTDKDIERYKKNLVKYGGR
jgi:hypothetical protein